MENKFEMLSEYATEPLYEGVVMSEVAKDYTLPDYQPEVRRVLHVGTQILPPAKYVTGNRAELNGNVEYTVLYVGMDGELYSAPLSAEYSAAIPLEDTGDFDFGEGICLMADTVCETVNTRLTAPRRLSIKSRLRSKVGVYGQCRLEEDVSGGGRAETLQRLDREGMGLMLADGLSEVITLSHSLPLPAENARVVTAEAGVFCEESQCAHGRVSAAGRVEGRLLCAMEDGEGVRYETIPFVLPFEGEIEHDLPESGEECRCRVSGRVGELSVNAAEGDIQCQVGVILDARVFSPKKLFYTEDLYATDRATQCEYEEHRLPVLQNCFSSHFSQSERLPLSGLNLPEGCEILTAYGRAMADEMTWEMGKSVISGRSHYTVICRKEDEISSSDLILPFRFEWDCPEKAVDCLCAVEVMTPKVKAEGDTLMLDAELFLTGALLGTEEIRRVRSADFGEPLPSRENAMIVCYPCAEDTVWSIAKRYAVPTTALVGDPSADRYVMIR